MLFFSEKKKKKKKKKTLRSWYKIFLGTFPSKFKHAFNMISGWFFNQLEFYPVIIFLSRNNFFYHVIILHPEITFLSCDNFVIPVIFLISW